MDSHTRKWMDIALEDFQVAKIMFANNRHIHCLFMCQQALEKMIKAVYQETYKKVPPRKHDLLALLKAAGLLEECSKERRNFLRRLSVYYLETRYPDEQGTLATKCTRKFAFEVVCETEEVISWLQSRLK